MTGPLLRIKNQSGGLVLSADDSFGLNYLGAATNHSLTQASGDPTSGLGKRAGVAKYRITSAHRPVVFLGLPLNKTVKLVNVALVGTDLWEISAYCGNGTLDADGFEEVEYLSCYCFAQPATDPSGPKLRIKDDAGNLRWLISGAARLLYLKGSFTLTGTALELDAGSTAPSLTTPAVLGMPQSWAENSSSIGSPLFDCREIDYGWQRTGSTEVVQASYRSRRYQNDGGNSNTEYPEPTRALFIDAAGL